MFLIQNNLVTKLYNTCNKHYFPKIIGGIRNDVPLRILVLLWGPLNAKNFPVEMKKNYGEENENWFIIY
jgi:hypothetical protein